MAVTGYSIEEEVLAPAGEISINYKGSNPFRIYRMLPKMLQLIFHGRGKNIFERSFKWDITTDPREFSFDIWFEDAKMGGDARSRQKIRVRCHGHQPSDPNSPNGIIKIAIKAWLTTSYGFNSQFEKMMKYSFVWMYHRLWYNNIRRRYLQILKEQCYKLEKAIREAYGIEGVFEKPELTGGPPRLYYT
jgi:hypothetical protein